MLRESTRPRIDSRRQLEAAAGLPALDGTTDDGSPADILGSVVARSGATRVLVTGVRGAENARRAWTDEATNGLSGAGWRIARLRDGVDEGAPTEGDGASRHEDPAVGRPGPGGAALREALARLGGSSDLVVIELPSGTTAPLGALAEVAGATVIVAASGRTSRQDADEAGRAARAAGLPNPEMLLTRT